MSMMRLDGARRHGPTSMERHHVSIVHAAVKSEPVCGDHSTRRRYMRAFQSPAIARIPHWWFSGAVGAPIFGGSGRGEAGRGGVGMVGRGGARAPEWVGVRCR